MASVCSFTPLLGILWRGLALVPMFVLSMGLNAQTMPTEFLVVEFITAHTDAKPLKGYLSRSSQDMTANPLEPLVVALHGCDGLWNARGELALRYREYQAWLKARGLSLLLIDSFSARGKPRGICNEPFANRSIRPADRRLDVQGALRWLNGQAWVDKKRLFLLGWSHGGSTVLSTLDRHALRPGRAEPIADPITDPLAQPPAQALAETKSWSSELPNFKAAVAFYPGCGPASQNPDYLLETPLLLMMGEDDDWTPARSCLRFHQNQVSLLGGRGLEVERFQLKIYPGAHHGFDSSLPVRHRPTVPHGTHRGQGVHAGGHPPSREDALKTLDVFLKQYL
jgi:dienelactone hydrolase